MTMDLITLDTLRSAIERAGPSFNRQEFRFHPSLREHPKFREIEEVNRNAAPQGAEYAIPMVEDELIRYGVICGVTYSADGHPIDCEWKGL